MPMSTEIARHLSRGLTGLSEALQVVVKWSRLGSVKGLKPPGYATPGAVAFDLQTAEAFTLRPGESKIVETGTIFVIPDGYEGEVRGRSGLAFNHDIIAHNGTIDSDYRGTVMVKIFNLGEAPYRFERGDRVAQMIVRESIRVRLDEVDYSAIDKTARGTGGFGSTGK